MKISIIGTGYVGVTTGVAFAEQGFDVICIDKIKEKIENLNDVGTTFYEPGLNRMLKKLVGKGLIKGSIDLKKTVKDSDVSFICVGTPSMPNGSIGLEHVKDVAKDIGKSLEKKKGYHLVVVKSTVIPLTTEKIVLPIIEKYSKKKPGKDFGLCMNPEFLKEGDALNDALHPDRVVIGEYDKKSGNVLMELYKGFKCRKMRTNLRTAEMIKYASNSFLATKITFANEMANICEKFGIDVYEVTKGVGLDKRISPHFLNAGCGFGGSCFKKDISAIVSASKSKNYTPKLLESVLDMNETQPLRLIRMAESVLGNLKNKKIALLGLSFKPDTDDVRETRAVPIAKTLLKKGAKIVAYDPRAMENFKKLIKDVDYAESAKGALKDADACIIQSDWKEFKELKIGDFKKMRKSFVVDGRRTFDPEMLIKDGVIYMGIGWNKT
ncbi:MAG: UDP-glucose/GDP-mannose dehydrogenase family protein [Candidatus Thermoplasmatota archaeon]|nr:UDP-glucose/GDP-mannose dehydrogenase family protein [Candidatus Thermoplasmatota archaeon]MBU4256643.1 UDP-glucose/GDP-mannose dehydrogenase family protein [Candidatus Thermoplasmatota archaeon]MCG2827369.1 UDP-glucose/GDP-mannose dehydrogenase family protein [Thermoplasmatales archaeon]